MAGVLLAGADGQLGWEVGRRAGTAGISMHPLSHQDMDITDRDTVLRTIETLRPRVVINAAAYTAVDRAESDSAAAYAVNRDGPAHLAEACALNAVRFIHISTDYVFDGTKAGAYTEDDPVAPLGVYGASKLAGEEAVRERCRQHVILRTAWVYGIHGRNFVKTILAAGRKRDVLRVVDDQRGSPTFAGDLADAVVAICRRLIDGSMPPEGFDTFHCAGQGSVTWCGFARRIFSMAAPRVGRRPVVEAITTAEFPTTARRPGNSVLDCDRLERVHGIRLRSWEEALAEMLEAVLDREEMRHGYEAGQKELGKGEA